MMRDRDTAKECRRTSHYPYDKNDLNLFIDNSFTHFGEFGISRKRLIVAIESFLMVFSFFASLLLRENFELQSRHVGPLITGSIVIFMLSLVVFTLMDLPRAVWSYATRADFIWVMTAITLVTGLFVGAAFLLHMPNGLPRSVPFIFWLVAIVTLSLTRFSYRYIRLERRPRSTFMNGGQERILLVGPPGFVSSVTNSYGEASHSICFVGVIDDEVAAGRSVAGIPVLGKVSDIPQVLNHLEVRGLRPHRCVVAMADLDIGGLAMVLEEQLQLHGIACQALEPTVFGTRGQPPVLPDQTYVKESEVKEFYRTKRAFDVVVSGTALLFCMPLMLLIAAVTWLSIGAPVLFEQNRAGLHMRPFTLRKFRTMRDPSSTYALCRNDAARLTRIGFWLRRMRLDELPQLWNVFVGEMSLVGPRPLLPRDLPGEELSMLARRSSVKPGLTGWAQVNGGKHLKTIEKVALDLYYIENTDVVMETKIVLLTIKVIILGDYVNRQEVDRAITTQAVA